MTYWQETLKRSNEAVWGLLPMLAPDLRAVAEAELRAVGLVLGEPSTAEPPTGEVVARLRAATTVLACDAILKETRQPDWDLLTAEHRREPFGRVQRRALIARRDCPGELTRDLLTPWDSLVAGRLRLASRSVPKPVREMMLTRVGDVHREAVHTLVREDTVEETILAAPRLDLLVRAAQGWTAMGWEWLFWQAAGRLLQARLDAGGRAWRVAAARFAGHRGTFAGLLRRARRGPDAPPVEGTDLRLLAQVPDRLLVELVSGLPDDALERMWQRDLLEGSRRGDVRMRVMDRFAAAGVPPRALFAAWLTQCAHETRAWAYGYDEGADRTTAYLALTEAGLRRRIAARFPVPGPVTDLVGALRAARDPFESEAVLSAATRDGQAPPWTELVAAHQEQPWPEHVLCVVADRPDLPRPLARALPEKLLDRVLDQSPEAARAALPALDRFLGTRDAAVRRIHHADVLTEEEILAAARPAKSLIRYLNDSADTLTGRRVRLRELFLCEVETAARSTPPGFWSALVHVLDDVEGTLADLLATAAQAARSAP
ncbi:MAG TPA: hypothetical protein VFV66_26230 [Nonomuraea sp.]|nr:hypothetical protein [Nonomuraea sp.]